MSGFDISLLLIVLLIGVSLYTLYCLRGISRKLNWWRNQAVTTNAHLRTITDHYKKK